MKYLVAIELEGDVDLEYLGEKIVGASYNEVLEEGRKLYGEGYVPSDVEWVRDVFEMKFGRGKVKVYFTDGE